MKNWEKYEKEIREIGVDNLAIINDKPVSCCDRDGARCFECQLDVTNCEDQIYDWLYLNDEIRVGDIVKHDLTGTLMYVTKIHSHNRISGIVIETSNGYVGLPYVETMSESWIKTSKHYPLDKVIELIGGDK